MKVLILLITNVIIVQGCAKSEWNSKKFNISKSSCRGWMQRGLWRMSSWFRLLQLRQGDDLHLCVSQECWSLQHILYQLQCLHLLFSRLLLLVINQPNKINSLLHNQILYFYETPLFAFCWQVVWMNERSRVSTWILMLLTWFTTTRCDHLMITIRRWIIDSF